MRCVAEGGKRGGGRRKGRGEGRIKGRRDGCEEGSMCIIYPSKGVKLKGFEDKGLVDEAG